MTLVDEGDYGIGLTIADHFAYTISCDGLRVFDIRDPQNPIIVNNYITESVQAIATARGHLYISGESSTLRIVNIHDSVNPVRAGSYVAPGMTVDVSARGHYIYTADHGTKWGNAETDGGIRILAETNARPLSVIGSSPSWRTNQIAIAERYAYLTWKNYWWHKYARELSGGIVVVDITRPQTPQPAGALTMVKTSDRSAPYPQAIAVIGTHAYVGVGRELHIIDVTNPANLTPTAHYETPETISAIAVASAASKRYAYVTSGAAGLRIIDVTEPQTPIEVASYSDRYAMSSVVVAAPPYAPNRRYAYLGSGDRLKILDVTNPAAPTLVGATEPLGVVINDVALQGPYLYLAAIDGLTVVTAANPATPVVVTTAALPAPALSVATQGNRVYVAAGDAGLFSFHHGGSITGRVAARHGRPMQGVTLALSNGMTIRPDETGFYAAPPLAAGTYTMLPTLPGYAFVPPAKTFTTADDVAQQDFTILPAPVTATLTPNAAVTVTITDTQDLTMKLDFPTGTVAQTATLTVTPTLAAGAPGMTFTGHAFELAITPAAALQAEPSFGIPVTVIINYSAADAALVSDMERLALFQWTAADGWVDAASACTPSSSYTRDPANRNISVAICQTGRYALLGPTNQIFVPIVRH
jgi:hypothetical protein